MSIVWLSILTHLVWGVALVADERAGWATATSVLHGMVGHHVVEGLLVFLVGVLALVSEARKRRDVRSFVLLIPQQLLLFISAYGSFLAVTKSQYGDGVPRPFLFILVDQFAWILVAIFHAVVVAERHAIALIGGKRAA